MMTFSIVCPQCKATLKSSKPVPAGKSVTCPKCSVMFSAPANKPKPVAVPAGVDVVDEDDEFADVEIVEDPPKKKEAPKRPIAAPGADRPRKKRKQKSNVGFIIGLCAGLMAFAGFVVGAIFGVKWLLAENNDPIAFLPAKPVMMISVDTSRVMESPFASSLEALFSSGEMGAYLKEAGVAPKNAFDRITFGVGPSRPGVPGAVSIVLMSKNGFDKQKFTKAFNASAAEFGGRKVFQSGAGLGVQTYVFTSRIAAIIGGTPSEAEDVVRTAGRNSPTTLAGEMVKRVSGGDAWMVFEPAAIVDNPATKAIVAQANDVLGKCRNIGFEANLSGDFLEFKSYMLMTSAQAAEAFVDESKKQASASGSNPLGFNPVDAPSFSAQGDLATVTVKFKSADLASGITALARMASMFAPTAAPSGGGPRGGRGGR